VAGEAQNSVACGRNTGFPDPPCKIPDLQNNSLAVSFLTSVPVTKPEVQEIPCCFPVNQGIRHREGFDPDCAIRHPVRNFGALRRSLENSALSSRISWHLRAPEKIRFDCHSRWWIQLAVIAMPSSSRAARARRPTHVASWLSS